MEAVLYTFCAYLPIHLLGHLPFLDLLRFGKSWAAFSVACNLAIHLLGVAAAGAAGHPEMATPIGLVMVPVTLGLYFLNIKLSPGKLLFTYMLLVMYQNIAMGIAAFLAARAFGASARSAICGLLCLAVFVLAWRPMYLLFRYASKQVYSIDAPRLWQTIWLLPAIISGVVTALTIDLSEPMVKSWQFLFIRTSLLPCAAAVYWVLLSSLDGIRQQAALQEQLLFQERLLDIQVNEQQKHQQLMVEHEEQLARQRHDLRHQLATIEQLAEGDPNRLKKYVAELLDFIPSAPQTWCSNPAVNAVVSHYIAQCEAKGIKTQVRLALPEHPEDATDAELCVIFGNLLENALEACDRVQAGDRFIRLTGTVRYGILTITMDNSFDGDATLEDGAFRSRKHEGCGIGLASICTVAARHGGNTRFEPEGSVFRSSIYLQL